MLAVLITYTYSRGLNVNSDDGHQDMYETKKGPLQEGPNEIGLMTNDLLQAGPPFITLMLTGFFFHLIFIY